jgi:hypothetical protein
MRNRIGVEWTNGKKADSKKLTLVLVGPAQMAGLF